MNYYTYNEAKTYLKDFNIKSSHQFYKMVKESKFNNRLNKYPYAYYNRNKRKSWISWDDFLSYTDSNEKYLSFEEAREYVITLNIKTVKEWYIYHKDNSLNCMKIPLNPNVIYKNLGWTNYTDWLSLGNTSYKSSRKINYINYDECRSYIIDNKLNIKSKIEWENLDKTKLPLYIPKRPDYLYKKTGEWIDWSHFLNTPPSASTKSKYFLTFNEAKEYIKNLNLNDMYEYHNYITENSINILPKRPDSYYKKEWKGYLDYLNIEGNRTSIGERLIKSFLDDNNITYEREKKFDNCVNKKKLPFDFYIPIYNICIEYDGELHYKSFDLFGGDETLKRTKENDRIKNKFCKNNNIKLIRIHYLKKQKINSILKDLFKKYLN